MALAEHPYLDLARMEALRRIRLRPRGVAEGSFAGPHHSHWRGTSVEFSDYREYIPGDDIRLIDWKVFGRTDKYYVRLYEAERNLLSYIVLDRSGSMAFSGVVKRTESKFVYACRLAAALSYLVVREGDEVSLSVGGAQINAYLPARGGWTHLSAVLQALSEGTPQGTTDMGACLSELYRRASRRGVLIVLSDFLYDSESFWQSVDLFRVSRFDVMLFHVLHPEEEDLPAVPLARFEDPERKGRSLRADPDVLRERYRRRFASFVQMVQAQAETRGCDWFRARTDLDLYTFLKACFLKREKKL